MALPERWVAGDQWWVALRPKPTSLDSQLLSLPCNVSGDIMVCSFSIDTSGGLEFKPGPATY